MNPLDLAPENKAATVLKQIEDELRELKNLQRHSGESGLRGYIVQSANEWDSNDSVDTGDPMFGQAVGLEIIFTASGKQPYPIMQVFNDLFFGGTDESNRLQQLGSGYYGWDDGVNSVFGFNIAPTFDKSYSDNATQYRWTIDFTISGSVEWFMKAYAGGSSDGTIEVNRVY